MRTRRTTYLRTTALVVTLVGCILYILSLSGPSIDRALVGKGIAIRMHVELGGFQLGLGWGAPQPTWLGTPQWGLTDFTLFGFHLGYRQRDFNGNGITEQWLLFGLPWWFLLALWAAPTLDRRGRRWQRRLLATKRLTAARRRFRCPSCGYDCRATPQRCPECGIRLSFF
jgi:hypothetical protein